MSFTEHLLAVTEAACEKRRLEGKKKKLEDERLAAIHNRNESERHAAAVKKAIADQEADFLAVKRLCLGAALKGEREAKTSYTTFASIINVQYVIDRFTKEEPAIKAEAHIVEEKDLSYMDGGFCFPTHRVIHFSW